MKKEIVILLNGKIRCIIPDNASAEVIVENVRDLYKGQGEITTSPFESEDWSQYKEEVVEGGVKSMTLLKEAGEIVFSCLWKRKLKEGR